MRVLPFCLCIISKFQSLDFCGRASFFLISFFLPCPPPPSISLSFSFLLFVRIICGFNSIYCKVHRFLTIFKASCIENQVSIHFFHRLLCLHFHQYQGSNWNSILILIIWWTNPSSSTWSFFFVATCCFSPLHRFKNGLSSFVYFFITY